VLREVDFLFLKIW